MPSLWHGSCQRIPQGMKSCLRVKAGELKNVYQRYQLGESQHSELLGIYCHHITRRETILLTTDNVLK
jgi:hypothetical protein